MVGLVRDEKCMQLQVWATCFACHTSNTSTAHDCRMDCSRGFYYILLVASHFILSLGFKKKFHCDKVPKMRAIVNFEHAFCMPCALTLCRNHILLVHDFVQRADTVLFFDSCMLLIQISPSYVEEAR